jgi:hypothetical protein
MLKNGPLLGGVYIYTLVLLIDKVAELFPNLCDGELFFVKALLLLPDLVHI